jgi:4-hydroxythreonine-4-phosphate dehydrogenase
MERPILAITLGDPAGIGPEITLKALAHPDVYARCRPLVIGDAWILNSAKAVPGIRP